jgi:4-alpha-glucanotransferase
MPVSNSQLHHLAGLYGIRTSYLDMNDHVQPASEPALLSILESIGAPVKSIDDVPAAIRETQQNHWRQPVEPVIVVWEKETPTINLRLPATLLDSSISGYLRMEDGTENHLIWKPEDSSVIDSVTIENIKYISTKLYYPERLPCGYHSLKLDLLGQTFETLIIVAPLKAYVPAQTGEKIWGTFLPLYALKTQQSQGIGDFSDLEKMMRWTAVLGGQLTGTLPLLPSFIKDKFGPSPYMPASRLFWNELYLDLERIPEMENCPSAKEVLNLPQNQKALTTVKNAHRVDYEQVLSLKRQVLEILCSNFCGIGEGDLQNIKIFSGTIKQ